MASRSASGCSTRSPSLLLGPTTSRGWFSDVQHYLLAVVSFMLIFWLPAIAAVIFCSAWSCVAEWGSGVQALWSPGS